MGSNFFEKLNKAQQVAVRHEAGPLLVVAGAGTGKTTLLINRLAYLILNKHYSTDSILLLTFTEKAAGELEERADRLLPYGYFDLWIHTFHGFGERLLREHALDIGLPADFKLLTETEQWILVYNNLQRFALKYYRPLGNPTKFISSLLRHFSRLKDENISPETYLAIAGQDEDLEAAEREREQELAHAYQVYNQLLLENSQLDFGDLIVYTLKLFKERPHILARYQKQFRQIMVDEFQDTNGAQYELIKMLAAPANNLAVVGDDDQSIYKFRGASLSNIMQFKDDFPQAVELVLTDNYRSRQEILDKAYHFIRHNNPYRLEEKLQLDKKLVAKGSFAPLDELAVSYWQFPRAEDEVAFVVEQIISLQKQGRANWLDCAILVRANDTADAYVQELARQHVPHQFVSLRGLYFKPIILDCLAYLRLLDNYHESAALFRLLNLPQFKVSYADLITINKEARRRTWSLFEALEKGKDISGISADSQKNIAHLLTLIKEHSQLVREVGPSRLLLKFLNDSGLIASLDFDYDKETFSYLNQFYQKMKRFEDGFPDARLADFVNLMNLELEAGESGALRLEFEDNDTVKVMTVHAAKGLEFKYVFLVNLVDKRFPTINRSEKISIPETLLNQTTTTGDPHLEEERRLFYVAATRAKEQLFITGAKDYGGARAKKPSVFIEEMGVEEKVVSESTVAHLELVRDLNRLDDQEVKNIPLAAIPQRFSYSQLATFSTCPLKYKFAFVLKIPTDPNKASLIFGRAIHNTLWDFLKHLERSEQESLFKEEEKINLSFAQLKKIYNKHWSGEGFASKEESQQYYDNGLNILQNFWNEWSTNPAPEILYLEKSFTFKVSGGVILGKIDRVDRLPDGSLEVIDYKTGNPKKSLETDDKRQLMIYQVFLEEVLGAKVSRLSYYYLEGPHKVSFTAKPAALEKVRQEIIVQIKAIKDGQFPANPSPMCAYCDFNHICPYRQI